MKKYEIVRDDCIVYNGRTLYRIRALKDFWTAPKEMIHKGDLGGYVESENNLSQEGYCWIRNNAKVYDNAKVLDDAVIYKHAEIFGYAVIRKNAQVNDNAQICGAAEVFHNAKIYGNAVVTGKAQIYNNAQIHGFAVVCGKAKIRNYAQIYDSACVSDEAEVCGSSLVCNVTPDGEWLEPGTMGWFGISSATANEEREWYKSYQSIIKKFAEENPDYVVTLVDCHI